MDEDHAITMLPSTTTT